MGRRFSADLVSLSKSCNRSAEFRHICEDALFRDMGLKSPYHAKCDNALGNRHTDLKVRRPSEKVHGLSHPSREGRPPHKDKPHNNVGAPGARAHLQHRVPLPPGKLAASPCAQRRPPQRWQTAAPHCAANKGGIRWARRQLYDDILVKSRAGSESWAPSPRWESPAHLVILGFSNVGFRREAVPLTWS